MFLAPVEIALDDSVLTSNALALKNSTVPLLPDNQTVNEVSLDNVPTDLIICDENNYIDKENHIKIENYHIDDQELRRSKRKKNDFEDDISLRKFINLSTETK